MLLENAFLVVGSDILIELVAPLGVLCFESTQLSLLLYLSLYFVVSLPYLLAYPLMLFLHFVAQIEQVVLLLFKCLSCNVF